MMRYDPQENIIREFNLNELFQKSKKLNKGRGLKDENSSLTEEVSTDLGGQEDPTESKKDKQSKKDRKRGDALRLF